MLTVYGASFWLTANSIQRLWAGLSDLGACAGELLVCARSPLDWASTNYASIKKSNEQHQEKPLAVVPRRD